MTNPASFVWRDYETDGDSGSGEHKPEKADIRAWGAAREAEATAVAVSVRAYGALPGNTPAANDTALIAMRNAFIADDRHKHRRIVFPPGAYQYTDNRWPSGLTNVTIEGYGASLQCTGTGTFAGDYNVIGPREGIFRGNGDALVSDSTWIAETGHTFGSVAAGSLTLTLDDADDADNYSIGDDVFLHGYATQRTGYSPNLRFFEWATIAGKAGAVLTLAEPIKESYDADWPDFLYLSARTVGALTIADQSVGKPRIISLSGRAQADGTTYYYPKRVEIAGFKLLRNPNAATTDRAAISAREIVWRDVEWEDVDDVALDMREAETARLIDCVVPRGLEIDKLLGTVHIQGGRIGTNPDNGLGIFAATGVNRLIVEGAVCAAGISVNARDGLFVRGCVASGARLSDLATQGPLMPGSPSMHAGAYAEFAGCTLPRLPAQSVIGTSSAEWTYEVDDVDAADGTLLVPWTASTEPPDVLRRLYPGRLVWLASDPRVRGRVASVKDQEDGTVKIAFASGNIAGAIASGSIVATTDLAGPVTERVMLDGTLWNDLLAQQAPNPGLLRWEAATFEAGWTADGVDLIGDGATAAAVALCPGVLATGRSYTLTYDISSSSGSVLLRDSGSGSNKATLSGTSSGATATFVATGADLRFLTNPSVGFGGTLTVLKLVES